MTAEEIIRIYTDGACRGNPGPGGWGVLLLYKGKKKELSGAEKHTTNNRMELTAVIEALQALRKNHRVHLVTDSRYLIDGINLWLPKWRKNQWLTSRRKPVRNRDLWQRLYELNSKFDIDWHWVKGHSGDAGNERADELANARIDELIVSQEPVEMEERK